MMDDDCPAVSCIAPSVSSSYSTEPVSAITAKHGLMNETAPSLWSFEAYPSTSRCDNCTCMSNGRRGHEYH